MCLCDGHSQCDSSLPWGVSGPGHGAVGRVGCVSVLDVARETAHRARYSVHDLRHAFAVRVYESTHDIYATEKARGHANVGVTETYLRSLGLADGISCRVPEVIT
jgi:hypothetical protein